MQHFFASLETLQKQEDEHARPCSLDSLRTVYFYLVLDNVKSLLKIEKQKKVLEKLAITQSMIQPSCFSIIVINDALVQEIEVFGDGPNVFEEYQFNTFFLEPCSRPMLERVLLQIVEERFKNGHDNTQDGRAL
jgi:hypothetical protein